MPLSISLIPRRMTTRHRTRKALRAIILSLLFTAFAISAPAQAEPTVTIQPDSGPVESALFTILIEGLDANAVYSVEFVFQGAVVYSSEEQSDERGNITFPAGSTAGDLPGIYTVQVRRKGQTLASAEFELTAIDADEALPGTVTITPPSAPIGSMHVIRVSGLAAHSRYTIEIAAAASQQVAYRRARSSDRDGLIEIEVFAEAGDALGYQAIAIYDEDGEIVAQGGFTIEAPEAPEPAVAVQLKPSVMAAGGSVDIRVSGLLAYASASALVKSAEGVLIDSVVARGDKDGTVEMTFTSRGDLDTGDYEIEIFAEGDRVATAALTIAAEAQPEMALAAQIAINPPRAGIGSQHLIEVSGLQPGGDYMLNILDPAGAQDYATEFVADSAGAFSLRISSTPEDDIGTYTVEIRAATGTSLLASATLAISPGAEDQVGDAIATIEPQSAEIGSSHLILVSNLIPGEQVNFDVSFAGATVYRTSKTADAAGMARLELLTEPGDAVGDYLITAMRARGNQPTVQLTATSAASAIAEAAAAPAASASSQTVTAGNIAENMAGNMAENIIAGSLVDGRAAIVVQGERDQYMRISVRSDDFDPAVALFDRAGNEIAYSADSRGRKTAVIGPLRMPASGDYILEVFSASAPAAPAPSARAESAGIVGDFIVSLDAVSVTSIKDSRELPFSLHPAAPAAYYELPLHAGDSLTLSVNSDLDSSLRVLSSAGVELAFDDDSGRGLDAEISNLIIDRDGSYVLAVATVDELATGSGRVTHSHKPAPTLEGENEDGAVIVTLSDKAIRDMLSFYAEENELLILKLEKLAGDVEDLFVTATVDGMEVMSYSTMGVPDQLPLSFVMPMSGKVLLDLEKVGIGDVISLAVSLERP